MQNLKPIIFTAIFIFYSCKNSDVLFENGLCIENIAIIDVDKGIKEHQTIIVKDGKIFQITPTKELQLSEKNTVIDGSGKFMIPGLWDTHVHFSYIEELAPSMLDLFLAYGITSVRDTGGDIDFVNKWKKESLANPTDAPRVMVAGPLLDGMPNVYDGSDPGHPPLSVGLQTIEEVKNEINELEGQGVDFLKAYEMLTPEQFSVITKLGKEKGLKVTGHVPLSMDVISASNAGLNSMEHLRNLELSCASNAEELLKQRKKIFSSRRKDKGAILRSRIHAEQRKIALKNYDENKAKEVLKVLAKNQTWQIPTLALSTGRTRRYFDRADWQENFKYLPESIEQTWKKNISAFSKIEVSEFNIEYSNWLINMTGNIHNSGIEIMAGTDTPIFFLTPGLSLHEELVMLVEAGLSPIEALKTATINPAKYFNLENELGVIKEGNWADLVILDANPLENINNTKLINAVIKQGKYFNRNKLDKILDGLNNN